MSQMATAQRLTISQLQQALRNGTIDQQVGQLVLSSKINEDKKRKAAMAAQVPAQPPVAQQNLAYAAGPGIDEMPTNLPVAGMAGGGIVSFEEGGSTFIPMTYEQYMTLLPEAKQQYVNQFGAPPTRSTKLNPLQQSIGIKPPSKTMQVLSEGTPLEPQLQPKKEIPRSVVPVGDITPASANTATNTATNMATDVSLEDKLRQLNESFGGDNVSAGVRTKGSQGIGAFNKGYEVKPYTAAQAEFEAQLAAEMNPATGKPWTYEEKAAERKARQIEAGVDFDLFGKQQKELEGKKTLSDSRARLNEAMPWFEISERLGQAPKPGETTMTAISSAIARGGKSKAEIMDKEEARLDRIREQSNALALAQNNFNAAQFSGNDAEAKDSRNQIKAARKELTNLGIKGIDQQNEAAKFTAELQSKENIAAMQERGAWARLGKENATIQAITKSILKDNPNMTVSEAIKQAYLTKAAGSVYGAETRADSARLTALAGERKALFAKRPLMSSQIPAWEAQIKALDNQIAALSGGSDAGATAAVSDPYAGFSKINS
jgi:hypothetical protein